MRFLILWLQITYIASNPVNFHEIIQNRLIQTYYFKIKKDIASLISPHFEIF